MRAVAKIPTLLIGMGIGAVMGVLFAPRKGSITRAQIKNKVEEDKELLLEKKLELEQRKRELAHKAQNQILLAKNMIQKKGDT